MEPVASGKVADGLYLIDTMTYNMPRFVASYIVAADKIAIVDCGPTTSLTHLKVEIKKLGFSLKDITHLFISHIHLDHYGGAGSLLQELPNAQVVMHRRGARHAINPEPMLERTRAMVGDAAMARDGAVLPIPPERLRAVEDGDQIDLGKGHVLRMLHTPGHTNSALCMYDEKLEGLFVGDSAGVCFTEDDVMLAPAPSGDFDLEVSVQSIRRLQGLAPQLLFFPHFGVSRRASAILKKSEATLREWGDAAEKALQDGPEKVGPAIYEKTIKALAAVRDVGPYGEYMRSEVTGLSTGGYTRYFQRKAQD